MHSWEGIEPDLTPEAARAAVLAELAKGRTRRITVQRAIFGNEFVGTRLVIDALRWLREHRLAIRSGGAWAITTAGKDALDLAELLGDAS